MRYTHHIRVNLQAVTIGIVEVKRATAAATEVATALDTVDQWSIDQLDTLGLQMSQGLEELVAVLDLKGDLLDEPLAWALRSDIHAGRGGAEYNIVMHVVKTQESCLRAIRALVAIGDRTPQHLGIEAERSLEVGYQNPHVSNALNVDTHKPLPPCLVFSLLVHHKLQAVPIRVLEINAVRIPRTTTDLHAVLFQLGFERFVRATLDV